MLHSVSCVTGHRSTRPPGHHLFFRQCSCSCNLFEDQRQELERGVTVLQERTFRSRVSGSAALALPWYDALKAAVLTKGVSRVATSQGDYIRVHYRKIPVIFPLSSASPVPFTSACSSLLGRNNRSQQCGLEERSHLCPRRRSRFRSPKVERNTGHRGGHASRPSSALNSYIS